MTKIEEISTVLKNTEKGLPLYLDSIITADMTPAQKRIAINDATAAAGSGVHVIFGHVYEIDLDGQTYPGRGSGLGLIARDGQTWCGPGGVRLADNQQTNYALISNPVDTITRFVIDDGFVCDGNSANQGDWGNAPAYARQNGIILYNAVDCGYGLFYVRNCSASGALMRSINGGMSNGNWIDGLEIDNTGYIGTQLQQPHGVTIGRLAIRHTGDNGLDIEGNHQSADAYNDSGAGGDVIIGQLIVEDVSCGIFLESTGHVTIGNVRGTVRNVGIFFNRINSGSLYNRVNSVALSGGPEAMEAVRFGNQVGRTTIGGLDADGFDHVFTYAGAHQINVPPQMVTARNIRRAIHNIPRGSNQLFHSLIGKVIYFGELDADGFPMPFTPFGNIIPNSMVEVPNRVQASTLDDVWQLTANEPLNRDWHYRSSIITTNNNWNAASIYYNNETIVNIALNPPNEGDYLLADNQFYYVQTTNGNEITLRNTSGLKGDFHVSLNKDKLPVYIFSSEKFKSMRNMGRTDYNNDWKAYAVYSSSETLITFNGEPLSIGNVLEINNTLYIITVASGTIYTLRPLSTRSAGNYTDSLNSNNFIYLIS